MSYCLFNIAVCEADDQQDFRSLWCAVVFEQWRLVFDARPADRGYEIINARRWFGTRDFEIATTLAGLDPDWVLRGFRQKAARAGVGQ